MSPEEYVTDIKTRFGDQSNKDGTLIRDMNDQELVKRMIQRYPGDKDKILGVDEYLGGGDNVPATLPPTKTQTAFEQLTGGVANAFRRRNANMQEQAAAHSRGEFSNAEGVLYGAGQVAGLIGDVGFEFLKSIVKPEIKDKIKEGVSDLAHTDFVQGAAEKYKEFKDANPRAAANIESVVNIGTVLPGVGVADKAAVKGAEVTSELLAKEAAAQGAARVGMPSLSGIKDAVVDTAKNISEKGILPQGVKESISDTPVIGSGLGEQVKTASERLTDMQPLRGAGAAIRPDPLKSYDEFVSQESKHLGDLKADPAISLVGERIGDAYDSVIKMRQQAGETMGEALKSVGKTKLKLTALDDFAASLAENGVKINRTKAGLELMPSRVSKFTSADQDLLSWYINELDSLGSKPTVAQLDAFASRIPRDAKELLAKKNIIQRTNAERIINENLKALRGNFDQFPEYKAARSQYADLSKFLDEGVGFLGKKTQAGDYAKDASIAKSSVQSVLNNGKKDWLIRLEDLTGYPALDESLLALQAMKDLGDFKGNSLLELLAEQAGDVPSKANFIVGLIKNAGKLGGRMLKGTPVEQTRNYLRSINK